MENKYFTPDITDIRVGYECQMFDDRFQDPKNINWTNVILDDWEQVGYAIEDIKWRVRVPYLTKEQIEAEGWIHTGMTLFHKNEYSLDIIFEGDIYSTPYTMSLTSNSYYPSYTGQCKDINTFRYICKLINIK